MVTSNSDTPCFAWTHDHSGCMRAGQLGLEHLCLPNNKNTDDDDGDDDSMVLIMKRRPASFQYTSGSLS